jgi:hypothetical protein
MLYKNKMYIVITWRKACHLSSPHAQALSKNGSNAYGPLPFTTSSEPLCRVTLNIPPQSVRPARAHQTLWRGGMQFLPLRSQSARGRVMSLAVGLCLVKGRGDSLSLSPGDRRPMPWDGDTMASSRGRSSWWAGEYSFGIRIIHVEIIRSL